MQAISNKDKLVKSLVIISCLTIIGCLILLLPPIRSLLIFIGENILRRDLNNDKWMRVFFEYPLFIIFCSIVVYLIFSKKIDKYLYLIKPLKEKIINFLHCLIPKNKKIVSILMYLIIFTLIAGKMSDTLFKPYLFAEDAHIFIQRAIDIGYSSIFTKYAGYYHVIIHFIVNLWVSVCKLIGSFVPLPYMMQYTAHAVNAAMLCFFLHPCFNWVLQSKRERFICIMFIVLLIPSWSGEVWANMTWFQWWVSVFVFLCGLDILHNRNQVLSSYKFTIILSIICFSTPICIFIFAIYFLKTLFCFYLNRKKKIINIIISRHDVIKFFLVLIPTLIQIFTIMSSHRVINNEGFSSNLPEMLFLGIPAFFRASGFLLFFDSVWHIEGWVTARGFSFIPTIPTTGFILWLILIILSIRVIKNKNMIFVIIYSFLFSFFFWAFCFLSFANMEWYRAFVSSRMGGRYPFNMFVVFFFALLVVIISLYKNKNKYVKSSAIFFMFFLCFLTFERYNMHGFDLEKTVYWKDYSRYFEIKSKEQILIPTPHSIGVYMPISLDKIKLNYDESILHILDEKIEENSYNIHPKRTLEHTPDIYTRLTVTRISGLFQPTNGMDFQNIIVRGGNTYYPALRLPRYDEDGNYAGNAFYLDIPTMYFTDGYADLEFVGFYPGGDSYSVQKAIVYIGNN